MLGYQPKLKHLKVYGCESYPFSLPKHGNKFAARAKRNCIMVGYGNSDSIYWIYEKINRKLFRSRVVKFNEQSVLNKNTDEYALLEINN